MKKLLAILMTLAMLFSLAACGSDNDGGNNGNNKGNGGGSISSSKKSKETVAEEYMEALCKGDVDAAVSLLADFKSDDKDDIAEAFEEAFADADFDLIKVKRVEAVGAEYTDEKEDLEVVQTNYDLKDEISAAADVTVEIDIKNKETGEEKSGTAEVLCVEIDGRWYAVKNSEIE